MKKLMKLGVLAAIGVGIRKVMQQRSGGPDTTKVDLRDPQKTVQKVESAVGEPVRP